MFRKFAVLAGILTSFATVLAFALPASAAGTWSGPFQDLPGTSPTLALGARNVHLNGSTPELKPVGGAYVRFINDGLASDITLLGLGDDKSLPAMQCLTDYKYRPYHVMFQPCDERRPSQQWTYASVAGGPGDLTFMNVRTGYYLAPVRGYGVYSRVTAHTISFTWNQVSG